MRKLLLLAMSATLGACQMRDETPAVVYLTPADPYETLRSVIKGLAADDGIGFYSDPPGALFRAAVVEAKGQDFSLHSSNASCEKRIDIYIFSESLSRAEAVSASLAARMNAAGAVIYGPFDDRRKQEFLQANDQFSCI